MLLKQGDCVKLNETGKLKLQGAIAMVGWDGDEPATICGFDTLNGETYVKLVFTDLDDMGFLDDSDLTVPQDWLEPALPNHIAPKQMN